MEQLLTNPDGSKATFADLLHQAASMPAATAPARLLQVVIQKYMDDTGKTREEALKRLGARPDYCDDGDCGAVQVREHSDGSTEVIWHMGDGIWLMLETLVEHTLTGDAGRPGYWDDEWTEVWTRNGKWVGKDMLNRGRYREHGGPPFSLDDADE